MHPKVIQVVVWIYLGVGDLGKTFTLLLASNFIDLYEPVGKHQQCMHSVTIVLFWS